MVPADAKYSASHEWCKRQGQSLIIGITAHGLAALGDIIYVDLPEKGDDVLREVPFGEIEGTRDTRDVSAPADGVIEEINPRIAQSPELLAKDPYDDGWLIRLKPDTEVNLDNLMSANDYEDLIKKRKTGK